MIGTTLGHYKILDLLGAGGMGEVYRADDPTLDREVALKVLPADLSSDPDRLARFEREAKTLAALDHPNIVTIHSVEESEGVRFLTMQLVEGKPLSDLIPKGGMPLERIFDIASPLADALATAHEKGVIHRDLKPANIMLSDDGRVKVLDFGLAKLRPEINAPEATALPTEPLTEEGHILGTMPYMSPEQLEGKSLDARTDVFSLGVILYEMAMGERPFKGDSSASLIMSIGRDMPPEVDAVRQDLPHHLGRVIARCLEKDPDRRYQSVKDVRNELDALRKELQSGIVLPSSADPRRTVPPQRQRRWLVATGATMALLVALAIWRLGPGEPTGSVRSRSPNGEGAVGQTTVAVLPFQNLAADTSTEYLRHAVPDEITNTLARVPSLAVRPFAATAAMGSGHVDLVAVGKNLGAVNLVTGQYFTEGSQLQLTLEAIDVEENRLIWRQSLTVEAGDLLSLRSRVAETVRQGLLPQIGVEAEPVSGGTQPQSNEAYMLYARSLSMASDGDPNDEAIGMLERSLASDPDYAPARWAVAQRYYYDGQYGGGDEASFQRASEHALEAIRLDPELVEPATYLITLRVDAGDLTGAYETADSLVQRRPDSAPAFFARSYVFRYAGLLDESLEDCDSGFALDPRLRGLRSCALAFAQAGDTQRARDFINLDADSDWASEVLGALLLREDQVEQARQHLKGATRTARGTDTIVDFCRTESDEAAEVARQIEIRLQELEDPEPRYWAGSVLAYCGHHEVALRMLRQVIELNYCAYPAIDRDPAWADLRDNPEFHEIREAAMACRQRFVENVGLRAE